MNNKTALQIAGLQEAADEVALREIATQTFNFGDDRWPSFVDMVGRENIRVARNAEQEMIGGLSYYPIGQWFGGKSVATAGIALVCIAPEQRSKGYAFEMLSSVMRDLRRDGFPLATLYPSTQQFYRKLGFEQAGNSYSYACPLKDIAGCRPKLPMRRVERPPQFSLLDRLASERAKRTNGNLDRNEGMWKRLCRDLGDGKLFVYVVGEVGSECGYLIYDQTRESGRSSPAEQSWEQRSIRIRDMVALNADAMETIWALVASNATVIEMVHWTGPAADPRTMLLAEYEPKVARPNRWMLRLVDVRSALMSRGYPTMNVDLPLSIDDQLLPENAGSFTLQIRNGQPTIVPEVVGDPLQLDVRYFAALYSGFVRAEQLQAWGQLRCPVQETVSLASRVFSDGEPWMPEAF